MKVNQLTLRCFGELKDNQWTLVCVDLCLAAQASSVEKAKAKLESQIKEYLYDALAGQDKEFANQLLQRKAPLSLRARYHWLSLKAKVSKSIESLKEGKASSVFFTETMPVKPC